MKMMTVFWSSKRLPNVTAFPFSSRTSSLETAVIFSLVGMSLGDTLMSDVSSSSLVGPELNSRLSGWNSPRSPASSAGSGPSGPPRLSPINPRAGRSESMCYSITYFTQFHLAGQFSIQASQTVFIVARARACWQSMYQDLRPRVHDAHDGLRSGGQRASYRFHFAPRDPSE